MSGRIYLLLLALMFLIPTTNVASEASVSNQPVKAVLVTGATSGIGKEIATTLAQNGFYVFAGARKAEDIEALSKLPNMMGIRLDVTVQADIDAAVNTVAQKGYGLHGLVNNAGVFLFDALIEVTEADMQYVMDVNVFGPYRVTKAFAPLLMESKGRITTIGSIAGIAAGRLMGPYSMSKAAMESYTDALSSEMARFGVQVSVIEPGNFRSNIMKNMQRRIDALNTGEGPTLFEEEITRFASFVKSDRSQHLAPTPVAEAALSFLTDDQPRRRYLVAPNAREAQLTIRSALRRVVELNQHQPFTQSREELVATLDSMLSEQ